MGLGLAGRPGGSLSRLPAQEPGADAWGRTLAAKDFRIGDEGRKRRVGLIRSDSGRRLGFGREVPRASAYYQLILGMRQERVHAYVAEGAVLLEVGGAIHQRVLVADIAGDLAAGAFHFIERFGKVRLSAGGLGKSFRTLAARWASPPRILNRLLVSSEPTIQWYKSRHSISAPSP